MLSLNSLVEYFKCKYVNSYDMLFLLLLFLIVHLCNVFGEEERHYSLDLRPETEEHFCAFVSKFSGDNREILAS